MFLTILLGLVGLGIIIFIHETGHFIAAKVNGIEVETFSLGFGKELVGFDYLKTHYQISLIPFGGYCKMKGDELLKNAVEMDLKDIPKEKGSFFSVHPFRRIIVALSGPLANLLFALFVLTIIWWVGFNIYSSPPKIILASDYQLDNLGANAPATLAGLKTGDIVTDINGKAVRNFQDILEIVSSSPGKKLVFSVKRGSGIEKVTVVPELDKESGAGRIGIYSWVEPVVERVVEGKSAYLAGIRSGDIIISIDGKNVRNTLDIFQELKDKPEQISLTLLRGTKRLTLPVVLQYDENGFPDLGIQFRQQVYRVGGEGFYNGIVRGIKETGKTIGMTFRGIGLLFKGIDVHKTVAGPLRITYYLGTITKNSFQIGFGTGIVSFLRLLGLLSIVLFIMNLIPLPALDGGQIVLFSVEWIAGTPPNPKLIYRIQVFGFSIIILLAVMITFSDILFFFGK